eukprot:s4903_g1.t1
MIPVTEQITTMMTPPRVPVTATRAQRLKQRTTWKLGMEVIVRGCDVFLPHSEVFGSLFTQTSTHVYASPAQRPPSVAHRPLEQADFAGTRNGRVDVAHCTRVRTPNLRKTPRLERT